MEEVATEKPPPLLEVLADDPAAVPVQSEDSEVISPESSTIEVSSSENEKDPAAAASSVMREVRCLIASLVSKPDQVHLHDQRR